VKQNRKALLMVSLACLPWVAWAAGPNLAVPAPGGDLSWWIWPLLLFLVCFVIGVVAAMGGVGGGVLFVPIVSSFFPFHLDFVRGAGLIVALSCALAASPTLLRTGMVNLRLTMPPALVASASSIIGAQVGLAMPVSLVQILLGTAILLIVVFMALAKKSDLPVVDRPDWLSVKLNMHGVYHEPSHGADIHWQVHRVPLGLCLFGFIGFLAGMFGLGAGWANVPVLNLVMGAPLKVAAGSSMFILSIVDTTAAWVYLHNGAVMSLIAVPSVIGIMLGSMLGVRLFKVAKPTVVRRIVLSLLFLAGARALLKGWGVWP
jgi:hypothetical protein